MGLVISEGLRLKSYNTPAAIAGVAPTLDYRFALDRREIEAISLTDKLTYTGATNGTFVNRSGLIERATTDLPRFDHGPASRQSLGLLVEGSRENLLLRSEEFDNASWTASGVTVTANSGVAPDGNSTADKIIPTASASIFKELQQGGSVTSGTTYTVSFYLKAAGYEFIQILGTFTHFGSFTINYSLVTGAETRFSAGTSTVVGRSITPATNGWYRITASVAAIGTGSGRLAINIIPAADSVRGVSWTGDGTSGILFWGAQLEVGAFPTSYIPTTTTALTRPADVATIDGTGVITGTYTLVEKPAGCAVVNGSNIDLVSGFTAERVMVFPAALSSPQITAIRGAM